jgi:hypothetical protein
MARLISAKGQTGNVVIGSPQEGMRWILKYVVVLLHTSSTSGSRSAYLTIERGGNSVDVGPILATTGSVSGVSATFSASGDVTQTGSGNSSTIWYQYPEAYAVDILALFVNLITGDTVDYFIMVEEASS